MDQIKCYALCICSIAFQVFMVYVYLSIYFICLNIWIHGMAKLFKMPTNHRVSNKSKESELQKSPVYKG